MPTTVRLSFDVSATGPDLRLQVRLDNNVIWDDYPSQNINTVTYDFDDSIEQQHVLEFHMRGKQSTHTVIDASGKIIEDRSVHITNLAFDEIQLGHLFTEITQYYHNHNDTTDQVTTSFHNIMGCNGRAEMRFSTPVYLWLLENM